MLIQLETHYSKPKPRSLFYSYSHKDEGLRDELDAHLALLKRDGFISTWHDRKIRPGDEWDAEINDALNRADVILFLVSPHFLASKYCRDVEVRQAMERHRKHEALVVPIILKPVVFASEEFAGLQALPKNCRPLVEWPDSGFASVAEDLRTLMVDLEFPQRPNPDSQGHHGSWILKLESKPEQDNRQRAARIVARLQDFTSDYSISLQATSVTQVADGDKLQTGLMLILTGAAAGFSAIEKAHQAGALSSVLDDRVLQFYIIHGATVQGRSSMGSSADIAEAEGRGLLMRPGCKVTPPHLVAIRVHKGQCESDPLGFSFNRGDNASLDEASRAAEYRKLTDYFKTSLAIPDGLQWVNLSAFEADRMLPKELAGTAMGRALLSQDCVLKQLTASFMHPDSAVGRLYWNAVYAEARRRFGNSKMQFQSFQKVWILPAEAAVYEADGDRPNPPYDGQDEIQRRVEESVRGHGLAPGNIVALTLRNKLGVQCEADLLARNESLGGSAAPAQRSFQEESDFSLSLFREIVLPRIMDEVNEGEHFAEIRQIYSAMILATWLKHALPKIGNSKLQALADSSHPESLQMTITSINSKSGSNAPSAGSFPAGDPNRLSKVPIEHATPFDPAFDVPENVEFFETYVNLFRNGVFRCARNEPGDEPGEQVTRVYFSGAIDLRGLGQGLRIVR